MPGGKSLRMKHRTIRQVSSWIAVLAFALALGLLVHGWRARTIGLFAKCAHPCHDGSCCDDEFADSRNGWSPWLPIAGLAALGAAGLVVRSRVRESA